MSGSESTSTAPDWRGWQTGLGGVAVVVAAGLLILDPRGPGLDHTWSPYESIREQDAPEERRAKAEEAAGPQFDLRLRRRNAEGTEKLTGGATVHPGDRIQFVAYPKRGGHLMIVGQDPEGDVYKAFPKQGEGAQTINASKGAVTLPDTIGLDDELGRERILALICQEPFEYSDVSAVLTDGDGDATSIGKDCEQKTISLVKRARRAAPEEGLERSDLVTGLEQPEGSLDPSHVVESEEEDYPPSAGDDAGAEAIPQ